MAGVESWMRREPEEGALLVGMHSTASEPSMRKESEEGALLEMDSTGSESLMRKESEEEWSRGSEMVGMISERPWWHRPAGAKERQQRSKEWKHQKKEIEEEQRQFTWKQQKAAERKALVAWKELRRVKCIVANEDDLSAKKKTKEANATARGKLAKNKHAKKKTKNAEMEEGSGKVMVMEQQSKASPRGKKNPMHNRFGILDICSDDETYEIDGGKSAIEEADMPSDKKNPSDGGEEAVVTEGSGKSAMDEEVISPETGKDALRQLLKDTSNKLDLGGDDQKVEMDKGKSAIEEAYLPSDKNNSSDASEEAVVTEGSRKSAMDEDKEFFLRMLKDLEEEDTVDLSATNSMAIQDDHDSEMDFEADRFATYRSSWESNWSKTCGSFEDKTVLTSMQFTHHTPGLIPSGSAGYMTGTLQIFSIKLTHIVGGLKLPLSVYGVVAARDIVDRNRNILFYCSRSEAQELKQNDPFLHLCGPSRAIVPTDTVYIEIELKVKGAVKSQDKPLLTYVRGHSGFSTMCMKNDLCTLELCSQRVRRTVQATILSVQIVKGKGSPSLNFKYGGLVACTPLSGKFVFSDGGFSRMKNPSSDKIVLLESKDGPLPEGLSGYLHLWRQVVSVEFEGRLGIVIQAYSESGGIAAERCVHFMPKQSNISQKKFALDDSQVTITVAWSLVPTDKDEVVSEVGR